MTAMIERLTTMPPNVNVMVNSSTIETLTQWKKTATTVFNNAPSGSDLRGFYEGYSIAIDDVLALLGSRPTIAAAAEVASKSSSKFGRKLLFGAVLGTIVYVAMQKDEKTY